MTTHDESAEMVDASTMTPDALSVRSDPVQLNELTALVVIWSRDEPERVGELIPVPMRASSQAWVLGRGEPSVEQRPRRLRLYRQRPGRLDPAPPLQAARISREQLQVRVVTSGVLEVENV